MTRITTAFGGLCLSRPLLMLPQLRQCNHLEDATSRQLSNTDAMKHTRSRFFVSLAVVGCAAVIVAVASLPHSRAELPPQAYQQYQDGAPEALTITVQSVKIDETEDRHAKVSSIAAEARVDKVTRSASELKAGDRIRIQYAHRLNKEPVAGPSEPDILKQGQNYPAFLAKREDGTYGIAARGYSFRLAR